MSDPRFLKASEVTREGWYWCKYDAASVANVCYIFRRMSGALIALDGETPIGNVADMVHFAFYGPLPNPWETKSEGE